MHFQAIKDRALVCSHTLPEEPRDASSDQFRPLQTGSMDVSMHRTQYHTRWRHLVDVHTKQALLTDNEVTEPEPKLNS